ncbi:MAG: methylated-DNA--protein-cysteine methyltransferase [Patescibacteria group bacterium]|nr:MAG: methylated-DNA--protein-cysteine methyltransferase [Patescibacteria group bacterium]
MVEEVSDLVYKVVSEIPKGMVLTYGQIAKEVSSYGKNVSPRLVGRILHLNPDPKKIPCYRVVFKDGSLSEKFAFGGVGVQRERLLSEGVSFDKNGKVRLDVCLWRRK